jgi:hypothetical protein
VCGTKLDHEDQLCTKSSYNSTTWEFEKCTGKGVRDDSNKKWVEI